MDCRPTCSGQLAGSDGRCTHGLPWPDFAHQELRLPGEPAEWLPAAVERTGFALLDVTGPDGLAAGALPGHRRDPFDRMIIAQALSEGLVVVTRDARFAAYGVAVLPV